jgi:hypothetical protein
MRASFTPAKVRLRMARAPAYSRALFIGSFSK